MTRTPRRGSWPRRWAASSCSPSRCSRSPAASAAAPWPRRRSPRATRTCRSRSPRARASRSCSTSPAATSSCPSLSCLSASPPTIGGDAHPRGRRRARRARRRRRGRCGSTGTRSRSPSDGRAALDALAAAPPDARRARPADAAARRARGVPPAARRRRPHAGARCSPRATPSRDRVRGTRRRARTTTWSSRSRSRSCSRGCARCCAGRASTSRPGAAALRGPRARPARPRRCTAAGRAIELTRTEFLLLELFLRHPRQVLTRAIIFDRVWGYDFGPASNSLEVYVGYLRRKTEADGEPRLLHTVRGVGYVLRRAVSFRRRLDDRSAPRPSRSRWCWPPGSRTGSCATRCATRSTRRCARAADGSMHAPGRDRRRSAIDALRAARRSRRCDGPRRCSTRW